jgi:ureidoacrylate peracid hydrolase
MVDFTIEPATTAFLGVDLQNCFVENSPVAAPQGPQVVERLNALSAAMREAGSLIVWTRHVVRPDHANAGMLGRTVPPVQKGVIDDDSMTGALSSRVELGEGDVVLDKPRFGAFYGTELDIILRARGIKTIVMGGIATNVCCDATAREAHSREYEVVFLNDGSATFDISGQDGQIIPAETVQNVYLSTLAFGFAEVASTADIIARVRG